MTKKNTHFVCQMCGASHPKWTGKCDSCNSWNSLLEERLPESLPKGLGTKKGNQISLFQLDGPEKQPYRWLSEISEFDRVTGGGLVSGSAILVGGDPGIGKSTLLLQVAAKMSEKNECVYISGEEAIDQIRLRAKRLRLSNAKIELAAATSVRDICRTLEEKNTLRLVIIDSIQCMYVDSLDSTPGTVSQVRTSAQEMVRLAKRKGFAIILVGHVTKDGSIAGPRVLEHLVDTVLYFEGDRSNQYRILRSVKNRFGPADEIGVFEMTEGGLGQVTNPSALFLNEYDEQISGASVFAGIEGTRPVLVEIQSLIAPSSQGAPRRAVIGWESSRLAMLLAVLETRCGLGLASSEVYLNIVGGLKISEPAADLAVAASLISSITEKPAFSKTVIFGEIGLSGEIRTVSQISARLKEAEKLGFTRAIIPFEKKPEKKKSRYSGKIEINEIKDLKSFLSLLTEEP